jgi:hypothetical protein
MVNRNRLHAAVWWWSIWLLLTCTVDRRTDGLVCNSNEDCSGGRTCDTAAGYCVLNGKPCPEVCNSCAQNLCFIDCANPGSCGNVECPSGFHCTIGCPTAGGCNDVDCSHGLGCTITCSSAEACGTIDCGSVTSSAPCTVTCQTGSSCGTIECGRDKCTVTCSAADACKTVTCESSCACDVECAGASCPATMVCPTQPGNKLCTTDGTPTAPCDSMAVCRDAC